MGDFIHRYFSLGRLTVLAALFGLAFTFNLALSHPAFAATITVNTPTDELNSNGNCSLREAIKAANTDTAVDNCAAGSGADTINLPANTYTLALAGANEDADATGDLDITGALTLQGAGAANTIIDAAGLDRAIQVIGNAVVTLSGLTVQNGNASSGDGGGIVAQTITLVDVRVLNNTATGRGGGVYVTNGAVITGTLFQNNSTTNYGGGLYNFSGGTVVITNSQFISNTGGDGGGVALDGGTGPSTLDHVQFLNNRGGAGGGLGSYASSTTVRDSLFQNNQATGGSGGGMYAFYDMALANVRFLGNHATGNGGGVSHVNIFSAKLGQITNSLFASNQGSSGSAIYSNGFITITHVTIASPTLIAGQGIFFDGWSNGSMTVRNTIIANQATGLMKDGPGALTEDYNLFATNTTDRVGTITQGAHSLVGPAAFVNPATNDYHLTLASWAVDTGTNAGVTSDFEGDARPHGGDFDLGYDESPYTAVAPSGLTVQATNPTQLGSATHFTASLSAGTGVLFTWNFGDSTSGSGTAVNHTYAAPGAYAVNLTAANGLGSLTTSKNVTVTTQSAPTNTPTNTPIGTPTNTPTLTATATPTPTLTAPATPTPTATTAAACPLVVTNSNDSGAGSLRQAIAAAGPACSVINFAAGLTGQTIHLASPLTIAKNVTIDGSGRKLTISGDTNNDGTGDVAVFTINSGNVRLANLTIAKGLGSDGLGGGVSISPGAHVNITQSTIRDNISDNGALASAGGGIYNTGILTLTNSTVSGNQAASLAGLGGGIHSSFGSVTTIRYSTITGNSAPSDGLGGGINVEGGSVTLIGSLVSGNSAATGPEIAVNNGGALVINGRNVLGAGGNAGLDGATPGATDIVPTGAVNTVLDPTLADNGGDTFTQLPVAGGPAYDAIGVNSLGCGVTITVDQRNITRPSGAGCDAGAVESTTAAPPTPTFTPTATPTTPPTPTNPPTATPTATVPPTSSPTPTSVATQHDCTQAALAAAIKAGGTGTVTLDGTCRYLLTQADFNSAVSGASGELINQASVVEGNGALLERATNAPQFRLLIVSKPGIILRNLTLRGGNSPLDGGALLSNQDATLENIHIETSVAGGKGGGLYAVGNVILRNGSFSNNQAGSDGGGAYVARYGGTTTAGLVDKSSFIANRAGGNGGGLYHYGQTLQVSNSIFARNKATQVNGGAQLHEAEWGGALQISHSTFSDSAQNSNPALFVWSKLTLQNSIVAQHAIGVGTAGGSTYPVAEDYNLFAGNGQDVTVIYNGSNISRGAHSLVALDPRFINSAGDNYRLAANSPAINAGVTGGSATDADGQPRPADGVPDLGAYEFQGQPVAALQIAKEGPPWIMSNRASRYALTVFNAGKVAAPSLQISEALPSGATYMANSASAGGVFNNGVLIWAIGDLAPGASRRVEYQATANQTLVSNNYRVFSTVDNTVQEQGPSLTTPLNQKIVAALDFQPNPDGFAFPNYGDSPQSDLTADDMAFIFGAAKVCKSQNPCVLTAAAEAWRQAWLLNVEGGHCAGMAMGSLDIFANPAVAPVNFQTGANVTFDLSKPNARRDIALYATTQTKYPTTWATLQNQGLAWVPASTPASVVDALVANFNNPNAQDRYRLSIARPPAAGGGGGHTVVPYAVEQVNNDEYLIYIYENNAPNDYTRAIRVNRTANTWSYEGTTAPGQPLYNYYGAATDQNISLVSWRWASTFPKVCDSACTSPASDQVRAATNQPTTGELIEFQLDGEGYLLVTRNDGKRVGFDPTSGAWIAEIEGATQVEMNTGLGLNQPPLLQIPHTAGATYRVQVSNRVTAFGNLDASANVNIFGTNFAVRLTGLQINSPELTPVDLGGGVRAAGQTDPFDEVNVTFDPTNNRLTYQASSSDGDTPAVALAVNNPNGSDYSFTLNNLQLQSQHSLALTFDKTSGALTVENNDSHNAAYSVAVERVNQDGTSNHFQNDNVNDGSGVGVIVQVGNSWDGVTTPAIQPNNTPTLPSVETMYLPLVWR